MNTALQHRCDLLDECAAGLEISVLTVQLTANIHRATDVVVLSQQADGKGGYLGSTASGASASTKGTKKVIRLRRAELDLRQPHLNRTVFIHHFFVAHERALVRAPPHVEVTEQQSQLEGVLVLWEGNQEDLDLVDRVEPLVLLEVDPDQARTTGRRTGRTLWSTER